MYTTSKSKGPNQWLGPGRLKSGGPAPWVQPPAPMLLQMFETLFYLAEKSDQMTLCTSDVLNNKGP